jgi:hypothetical protein
MTHPSQVLSILCDARRMQTIQLRCRCGRQWTERVPQEVHDSKLVVQFECTCGRMHLLRNHHLTSLSKEEYNDRFKLNEATYGFAKPSTQQYDA